MLRSASLAALLLLAAVPFAQAATEFLPALSDSDAKAAGLTHLSAAQKAALERLAERDITLAREGAVTAFSGGFTARRSDEELKTSGIDTLSRDERENLDALVARAIADHPMTYQAQAVTAPAKPAVAAPAAQTWSLPPPKWEIHGDVSMTVGVGSHGSSFYGGGFDVFATDPSGKLTLGVGVSEYRGKGYFLPCLVPPCL